MSLSDRFETPSLVISWSHVPWDSDVAGFPVLAITNLKVLGANAGVDMLAFNNARDQIGAGLVSCRLSHEPLAESMLLEDHGFRFIEMLYQPELQLDGARIGTGVAPLQVIRAQDDDMPALIDIAGCAFRNERFQMDLRLHPECGNQRYRNWVRSSHHHARQQLYVLKDGERLISFFITELLDDGTCYWHLNAVAPHAQGQGYGLRAWSTMLEQARKAGAARVRTSIVARNHRVINLYARLGFHFPPPLMTFHWVREAWT